MIAEEDIERQAERLERLMPNIARGLFALDPDNPALDLPISQLRVCSILTDGPQTLGALGDHLGVSASAVSQLADRLERAGYVERLVESDDRRVRRLRLSAGGEKMMRDRRAERRRNAEAALARLGQEERAALLDNLERLLEATRAVSCPDRHEDPVGVRLNS